MLPALGQAPGGFDEADGDDEADTCGFDDALAGVFDGAAEDAGVVTDAEPETAGVVADEPVGETAVVDDDATPLPD